MDAVRGCVAGLTGVDDDHRPSGAGEHQGAVQSGGAAADHDHVVGGVQIICEHGSSLRVLGPGFANCIAEVANWWDGSGSRSDPRRCRAHGCGSCGPTASSPWSTSPGQTGISVSTLSRLESGDRRPTLELLLPLARAYGVTLDELVDAPPTGDPRIHMKPIRRTA